MGDIYLRSLTKGNKIGWNRLNEEDREYFIELKKKFLVVITKRIHV